MWGGSRGRAAENSTDNRNAATGRDHSAGAALAATDRAALEALLRYQLRPPLSKARLTRLDDGRVKTPDELVRAITP